jgi:hypothetical protein
MGSVASRRVAAGEFRGLFIAKYDQHHTTSEGVEEFSDRNKDAWVKRRGGGTSTCLSLLQIVNIPAGSFNKRGQ